MTSKIQAQPGKKTWPPQGQWTYDDYRRLPDDGWRYEVIERVLHKKPTPRPKHQQAIFVIAGRLWEHLQGEPVGQAFTAPIDVILPGLANPVQPDLLFIAAARLEIVKETFIEGAPDLVIEVLSPGNWLDDRRTKFRVYALAGVREYYRGHRPPPDRGVRVAGSELHSGGPLYSKRTGQLCRGARIQRRC